MAINTDERELARIKALREKHKSLVGNVEPHNHTIREIVDASYLIESVQNDLTESIEEGHTHNGTDSAKVDYGDLDSIPSTFPPSTHAHPTSEITNFAEDVSDTVGAMVSSNTETGITVTYQDSDNTIDFAVVYGDTANTAVQGNDDRVAITGFENRTDSTLTLSTRTVSLSGTFNIYSDGVKYAKTGGASCETTIPATVGMHFIYFDSTGTLQNSTSAWDITSVNVPTAIAYWNGSAAILYDERHSAFRDQRWHKWAHDTIGTRYKSGLLGTFATGSTTIGAGYIADEDIEFSISEQTSVRVWYRDGSNMVFDAAGSSITAKVVSGALKYDNAGVLTSVDTAKYVTNWLYATTETSLPIMLVTGQAQYSTIALARNATLPTFPNMPTAELKIIYRIIWQNVGGTPTYVESLDYRSSSTLPAGGTPSVAAAGVTLVPPDGMVSTNVQKGIEEVYDELQRIIVWNMVFEGDI